MKKALLILFLILGVLVWFFIGRNAEDLEIVSPSLRGEKESVSSDAIESSTENAELLEPSASEEAIDPEASNVIPNFPIESIPLLFPQQLDQKLRRIIATDLKIVYGDVESFEILEVDPPILVTSGGVQYQSEQRLEFFGRGRYFPEELNGVYLYGNDVSKQELISDEIAESYRIAKARRTEAPNVYKELEEFLGLMNDLDQRIVSSPEKLLYLHGSAKKYEKEMLGSLNSKSFQEAYGQYEYRKPSLLEIKKGAEFSNYLRGLGDKFVAKVYVYDQSDRISDGSPHFVYDEGQWKLLIVIPGT